MSTSHTELEVVFEQATTLLANGETQGALALAQQALILAPQNPDVINLIGVCAMSLGNRESAEQCWHHAIALHPDTIESRYNLAMHYTDSGRFDLAEQFYRQTVALAPLHRAAWGRMGMLLAQLKRADEAEQCYRQALNIDKNDAATCNNLGLLLAAQKRDEEAERFFRQSINLAPDDAKTHSNLGILLTRCKRHAEAERCFRHALNLNPASAEAYTNLGLLLESDKRGIEAEQCHRTALGLMPNSAEIHANLANLLAGLERMIEAEQEYRQALLLQPDSAITLSNLGVLLAYSLRDVEAEHCFRQALALVPDYPLARLNLAMLLLAQGRLAEGWPYHEARYHPELPDPDAPMPDLPYPQWQGESLRGKSLLVWPEQGYGDLIQFCRYLPLLKEQGAEQITLVCRPVLVDLMQSLKGVDAVISSDNITGLNDHYDFWTLPMSRPLHCHTDLDSIPASIPYLQPSLARCAAWRPRLPQSSEKLRVGLVWRGNPMHANDAKRSLPKLATLTPLWAISGVQCISLQIPHNSVQVTELNGEGDVIDLGSDIRDFADTAAILQQLDLLITVDTAVAHLAGALGKRCWVMLPAYRTDWRWMRERSDSPWYPGTMRLFRQTPHQSWSDVVADVAAALKESDKIR
ncbi:MAG TPA: tetratricopeptide repeat protein [Burkholderiaceae bacterium]|nr:tetratricopeptide repeat protein [Burkholderiaceae bacterium]